MSSVHPANPAPFVPGATVRDFLEAPDQPAVELIDGELIEKASPSGFHGLAQVRLGRLLGPYDRSHGSGSAPGGWWILGDPDVRFDDRNVFRPDVAGWLRARMPSIPDKRPLPLHPDWTCEIISTSNASNDTVVKFRAYHRFEVGHYWLLNPQEETLSVHRWSAEGYLTVLTARRGDVVRAEPFEAVEFPLGVLFGDDPP